MSFSVGTMRPDQSNPLDLNNFPEDYSRDTKLFFDESSSSASYRKKKSGGKDGKDESGKVYECRFCSLKFCKSQALGGHMNRHRQERETETLNRARQLVFSSDNLAVQPPHLGCPSMGSGSYHSAPVEPFRSVYNPRLYSSSSSTLLPQTQLPRQHYHHNQPYPYTSPSRPPTYSSQYNSGSQPHVNDYYIGQVLGSNHYGAAETTNYPFIGAPVGGGLGPGSSRGLEGSGGGRDGSIGNLEEGMSWGRSYLGAGTGSTQQQRLDSHSSINRFQDGF